MGGFHPPALSGRRRWRRRADTAHLGLVAASFGDLPRAQRAAGYLARLLAAQPDLDHGLHLRTDSADRVVDEFPGEAAVFRLVSRVEPDQAYFMVGYPIALSVGTETVNAAPLA